MKVVNLNVNGIEEAVKNGLFDWMNSQNVDVVCIQNLLNKEYKLPDSIVYPKGWNAYFFDAEPDNYSGVAIYTKEVPKAIMTGMGFDACDRFGRYIQADFERVSVGSVLFPAVDEHNSLADKLAFQQAFLEHLKKTKRKRREFIFAGTFWVAHKTVDLADWRAHQGQAGFQQEEQAFFDQITGPLGFVDAFREANFGENQFTWWADEEKARRDLDGWRMDYQLCSPELRQFVVEAKVDRENRFGGLHAPVIVEYELED